MKTLRLGTRKSALAQVQANWVADQLRYKNPDLTIDIVLMTTSGDTTTHLNASVGTVPTGGLKALFTKEIEEALLEGRIDLAVHSLKDMAPVLPPGLVIAAVPKREDPRDAWIGRDGLAFSSLPKNAKVGTSSVRRQAQLRHLRPDLTITDLRGNVETRLKKLKEEGYDGIVLAVAGLARLGLEKQMTEPFSMEELLPAVGQGALAIEIRKSDEALMKLLSKIDNVLSHQETSAERAFLRALNGNCNTPIAACAHIRKGSLTITGVVASPTGNPYYRLRDMGPAQEAEAIGGRLAKKLLAAGAKTLLNI